MKNNTSFQALQSIISGEHSNGKRKFEFVIVEEMVEDYQHEAKKSFAMGKVMYKKAYEQFKKSHLLLWEDGKDVWEPTLAGNTLRKLCIDPDEERELSFLFERL